MLKLTQPSNAPNFCFELIDTVSGATEFVQSDWDYPALASQFGFVPCECGATDGTVRCEHKTATEMITVAYDFLVDHVGEEVEGVIEDYSTESIDEAYNSAPHPSCHYESED